jgi:hypothetical protein
MGFRTCPAGIASIGRYEVLSGLRKAISIKMLTLEQAITAFKTLQEMNLEEIPSSEKEIAAILGWAERLNQMDKSRTGCQSAGPAEGTRSFANFTRSAGSGVRLYPTRPQLPCPVEKALITGPEL